MAKSRVERTEKGEELRIRPIKNGTVVDRITPGQALRVLDILGIRNGTGIIFSMVANVESQKMPTGRKDIVKIENMELSKEQTDKIAVISPRATINIVRNFAVVKKDKVALPDVVVGIIICPNQNCISNSKEEPVAPKFTVARNPLEFRCAYCDRVIEDNVANHIKC